MKKTIQNFYFLLGITLLCSHSMLAQSISGTIRENTSNLPLPGAEVVIKGTSIGASADFDGRFNLLYDNLSSATLVITYLGFESQEVDVSTYNDPTNITIMLKESTVGLEEVVISANLEGQRRALNIQRTADNITNIISTDLINRFPDLNVADALQRVPGINIDLDNGEGAGVTLRGTPRNFTNITINGEQLQNTGTDGSRTANLTQIPIDQLSQIEVSKTITPDMDGDAIGGSVNLKSPTARRPKLGMKAELGGGYNGLSEGVNFVGKIELGKRFGVSNKNPNGAFGLLFGTSYFQTDNGEDRTQGEWDRVEEEVNGEDEKVGPFFLENYTLRALQTERTRTGWSFSADYQFDRNNFIIARTLYNSLEEDELRSRNVFNLEEFVPNADGTAESEDGRVQSRYRERVVKRFNLTLNIEAQFLLGNLKIMPGYATSTGERFEDGNRGRFRTDDNLDLNISGLNSDFPIVTPPGGGFVPLDQYTDRIELQVYDRTVTTSSNTARIDLEHPFAIGNSILTLKSGYKNRVIKRLDDGNFLEYRYDFSNGDLSFADSNFNNPGLVRDNWLQDEIEFGPAIDPAVLTSFFNTNTNFFNLREFSGIQEVAQNFSDAKEVTDAGYFMARLRTGKFSILAGARYETVNIDYLANLVDQDEEIVIPVAGSSDYDFLLPNLQLKYELDDLTNIRAAYTKGYARQNFDDIRPRVQIPDDEDDDIRLGNINFKPPVSDNIDVLFERYLSDVGILSGGVFYKNIKDFRFVRRFEIEGGEFLSANNFIGRDATIPDNGEEATVIGVEVNIQSNLNFLPGFWKNFGIYLNYTYADSDATIQGVGGRQLPGQAPHTGNAAITFDYKGFSARVNGNFQDQRIQLIQSSLLTEGDQDLIRESRFQLDANTSYTFKKKWRIYAEINNITNAPQKTYWGDESRINDFRYFGFRSTFGISYTF